MKLHVIFANFASMASLRLGMAAITFALFWLLSHRLNTTELGGFSLLMSVFFMVQTLPMLGLTMPLMRRIAAQPHTAEEETSNSFFFALPVAAVIGACLTGMGHWYAREGLTWPFALLGLSMLPCAWTVVAECVLLGRQRTYGIASVNLLEALGRFVGAWAAIRLDFGLTGVFAVFTGLRLTVALAYSCNRYVPTPRLSLVKMARLQAYAHEVPTYLSIAVVTALCARVDIIAVSKLLSLHEAGIYAAAVRLSDAALMLPTMAAVVIFPSQSRLFEQDRAAFVRLLISTLRWSLIGGFALALFVIASSPLLVRVIYAPHLAAAAPILQIMILGTSLMVIDQLLSTTMMAARAQHADLRAMSLGLAAFTALLFPLTHFFGLMGTAMAAPASLLLRVLYRAYWVQNLFSQPAMSIVMRTVVAAIAGVSTYFLQATANIPANLLLALLAYGIALAITGALRATDVRAFRDLVTQRLGLQT